MPTSPIAAGVLAATFAFTAGATDIYKCVASDGRTAFQDSPCEGNMTGDKVTLHPNVVAPIDQSASIMASQALSERMYARRRAEDAEVRDRMQREASMGPPVEQQIYEPPYYAAYATYAYVPRAKHRNDRTPTVNVRSHVPAEQRKKR
jgi:hypothetical protein